MIKEIPPDTNRQLLLKSIKQTFVSSSVISISYVTTPQVYVLTLTPRLRTLGLNK